MTQRLRVTDGGRSNRMDRRMAGVGPRGGSFMDVDAISHDRSTGRFLVQEFKGPDEGISRPQRETLRALAALGTWFTVWIVVERAAGGLRLITLWADGTETCEDVTDVGYQAAVSAWWTCGRTGSGEDGHGERTARAVAGDAGDGGRARGLDVSAVPEGYAGASGRVEGRHGTRDYRDAGEYCGGDTARGDDRRAASAPRVSE
jgi:hypothetical protein